LDKWFRVLSLVKSLSSGQVNLQLCQVLLLHLHDIVSRQPSGDRVKEGRIPRRQRNSIPTCHQSKILYLILKHEMGCCYPTYRFHDCTRIPFTACSSKTEVTQRSVVALATHTPIYTHTPPPTPPAHMPTSVGKLTANSRGPCTSATHMSGMTTWPVTGLTMRTSTGASWMKPAPIRAVV